MSYKDKNSNISIRVKIIWLTVALALFSLGQLNAQTVSISTSVNKTVTRVNEQIELKVIINTNQMNQRFNPQLPALDGFELLRSRSGSSQNIQIINGKVQAAISYPFYLIPKREGDFVIGPVKIQHQGKVFESKPINIKVLKEDAQIPSKSPENVPEQKDFFLAAVPSKKTVHMGEGLTVEYRLYFKVNVSQYSIKKSSSTPGFWMEEYDIPRQPPTRATNVNGIQYNVATLRKVELFPTSSGDFSLDPLIIEIDVRVRNRSRRNRSIIDQFFDDPFGRTKKETLVSNTVKLHVLPLPDRNVPIGFSNAVGEYEIEGKVNRTNVKTNEAITYAITISGKGNIKLINEPELKTPQDFERYQPKIEESINKGGSGVYGTKVFEYTLIPRNPGSHKIEPVIFSFFNPATGAYRTVSTKGVNINVEKGDDYAGGNHSAFYRNEVTLKGSDIRFIKSSAYEWIDLSNKFYKKTWFYLFFIMPLLFSAGTVIYRRHLDRLQDDRSFARSRRAGKEANKRLSKAKGLMNENTREEFTGEVTHALEGFIADKLNISSAGIITDDLNIKLKERNIPEELITRYISCLEQCNYARFAPSSTGMSDLQTLYNDAAGIITDFGKLLK